MNSILLNNILKTGFDFVIWIFVPLTLQIIILFLGFLYTKIQIKRHRSAARYGFWAGIMLFIIIFIYQVNIFFETGFPQNDIFQGFKLWLALVSALMTFVLFLRGRETVSSTASGWLVIVFTFISCFALFHYLFIRTYNDILLSVILGAAFGFFAHLAASPSSIHEFLNSRN